VSPALASSEECCIIFLIGDHSRTGAKEELLLGYDLQFCAEGMFQMRLAFDLAPVLEWSPCCASELSSGDESQAHGSRRKYAKDSRRAGLLIPCDFFLPGSCSFLIYRGRERKRRSGAACEEGKKVKFEDSVDFRSYRPQLFNHRVKLPS
jgi:hypothetical protein